MKGFISFYSCAFIMFFRNLQAAVGSYFDINSANKLPSFIMIRDLTLRESIPPATKYVH